MPFDRPHGDAGANLRVGAPMEAMMPMMPSNATPRQVVVATRIGTIESQLCQPLNARYGRWCASSAIGPWALQASNRVDTATDAELGTCFATT